MSSEFKKIESILYVEDEDSIREELQEFLAYFCEKLYVAKNGALGLELFHKYKPKIVITDIKMPIMSGLEMAKEIKNSHGDVPIIFITAFSDTHYMQDAIALQVTGYILKPIDLDILELMINKAIETLNLKSQLHKKSIALNEYLKIVDENVITSSTDLNGVITYASKAFCKISNYSKEELIGKSHSIVRHQETQHEVYTEMWKLLQNDQLWSGELKNQNKDGSFYWVRAKIHPIYDENDLKIGYTAIHHDITNLKKVQELSIHDALTNLYNTRHFNNSFTKFILSSQRTNDLICFSILDIDYFKQYNDTYGHQKGDEVLVAVSNKMQEILSRADDTLFRLGGEEFGIYFKASTQEKALRFLNKIVQSIHDMKIPHQNSSVCGYVTISAGLEIGYAKSITSQDSMYKKADDYLYKAKQSGRNRVLAHMSKDEES